MFFRIKLNKGAARMAFVATGLGACAALLYLTVSGFVVGTLADGRAAVDLNALAAAARYFPSSARLHARLAEAEMRDLSGDLARARHHAEQAVNRSPHNAGYRLILASAQEAAGDRGASEASLRSALALSPRNIEARWRLANLLTRDARLAEALEEFRLAIAADESLAAASFDIVWRASGQRPDAVKSIAASPQSRLTLARFLLARSKPVEAAAVFQSIDPASPLAPAEAESFIGALVASGEVRLARSLWASLPGGDDQAARAGGLIWNGGFESDISKALSQFDWRLRQSEYARVTIEAGRGRSGARSLRVEFAGRDTTRLKDEVKQQIVLVGGGRYSLEFFARAEGLATTEGPRVVVLDSASRTLASSEPLEPGTWGWKRFSVEFDAPASAGEGAAGYVALHRRPRLSYDSPTRGAIWLDDFTLHEQRREAEK